MTDSTSTPENKTEPPFNEWTLEGFLDEIKKINHTMEDRSFAFILGAGASVSSGIPAGGFFAKKWMEELYQRQCLDKSIPLETWVKDKIHPELDTKNPAAHYPKIFEKRFEGDWQSGYASLEDAMEEAQPGLGYSLLAQILDQTRHKVIVTTNFDNLVANALAIHANKQPLVVGHEGLSGFVRPNRKRPLIAKIHRDLYFAPKNDSNGVDTLEKGWHEALQRLFSHYTPIVIGYGGNDGSLMNFLNNENLQIPGRIFWCYRCEDKPTNPLILDTVARHNGVFVSIDGFDELMLQLSAVLVENFNYHLFVKSIEEIGKKRAERHEHSASQTLIALALKVKRNPTTKNTQAWRNILDVLHDDKYALSWYVQAFVEEDLDTADQFYKKAMELAPDDADIANDYANFLMEQKKEYAQADEMYQKALVLDPTRSFIAGNYAIYLADYKKDYAHAEVMYQKALELDPQNPNITGNYATYLVNRKKDYAQAEVMYQKALKLDPQNANLTGNYAVYLVNNKKDYAQAEVMYKKALELDPKDATHTVNYANFLKNQKKDYIQAELTYQKALALDPENARITGNYANSIANFCYQILEQSTVENPPQLQEQIQKVIDLSTKNTTQTLAEAMMYRALGDELTNKSATESLSMLKFAIQQGYEHGEWDFSAMFAVVLPRIADGKRALYEALGAAILDEAKVADLDAFEEWVDLPAVSPFESV